GADNWYELHEGRSKMGLSHDQNRRLGSFVLARDSRGQLRSGLRDQASQRDRPGTRARRHPTPVREVVGRQGDGRIWDGRRGSRPRSKGEVADVVIASGPRIDELLKQGKVAAGSRVDVAKVGVGVLVRKGAAKPDIASADALKRALLAAKSIAYTDPAR